MKRTPPIILAMSLLALTACSSWEAARICCDGGDEYRHRNRLETNTSSPDMSSQMAAADRERQRLADELAAA